MRVVFTIVAALLALMQAACVVPMGHSPGDGHVPAQIIRSMQTLQSTRSEILMSLGAPDRRLLDDRVFGYVWSEAVVTFLIPAGYQFGAFTVNERRLLLIEFTPQGRTIRAGVVGGMTANQLESAVKAWLAEVKDAAP